MLGVCLKYQQKNYGSKLQALATVKMFEKFEVEYEIISFNKKNFLFYLKSIPRFFNIVFLNDRYDTIQKNIEFKRHPEVKRMVDERNKYFLEFDEKYFIKHLSNTYHGYKELKEKSSQRYSWVITCSDQLWSPAALGTNFYNLMFAEDTIKKISWASSFGVSNIPWYQINRTRKYLNRIDYISMRENRGAEIVKELIDKDVPVLMDPVFVFNKKEWEEIIPAMENEFGCDYIFCYFLGDNPLFRMEAKKVSEKLNLPIVTLKYLDRYVESDEFFGDYCPFNVSPEKFLNIIRNAKYVFTDSFHGTAFSILEEKNFVVFNRYSEESVNSKNSRIDTVCENLNLSSRRYLEHKTNIFDIIQHSVDYSDVKKLLENYRNLTYDFLKILCE